MYRKCEKLIEILSETGKVLSESFLVEVLFPTLKEAKVFNVNICDHHLLFLQHTYGCHNFLFS